MLAKRFSRGYQAPQRRSHAALWEIASASVFGGWRFSHIRMNRLKAQYGDG